MNEQDKKPSNPPAGEAMTMLDYFAAAAMQGILSGGSVNGSWADLSRMAYSAAKAMLQERSK